MLFILRSHRGEPRHGAIMSDAKDLKGQSDRIEKCGKRVYLDGPEPAFDESTFLAYLDGLAVFGHCLVAVVTFHWGWYDDGYGGDGQLHMEPAKIAWIQQVSNFEDYKYVFESDSSYCSWSEMDNYSIEWYAVSKRRARSLGL